MLKSREIVLIALFVSAIWIVVLALQSDTSAHYQICEYNQYTDKDHCAPHDLLYVILWYAGYIVNSATITAAATGVIAWFTVTISRINNSQLSHSHQVERAYISGGGSPETRVVTTQTSEAPLLPGGITIAIPPTTIGTGFFEIRVNNYGKTPGELWGVHYGFCEADNIPASPVFTEGNFHDWIQPGIGKRPLGTVPIPQFLRRPAIYGRFVNGGAKAGQRGGVKAGQWRRMHRHAKGPARAPLHVGGENCSAANGL